MKLPASCLYPKPFSADLNNCTYALISTHYGLFKNCTLSFTLCHSHDDDEDYNHSTVPQKYYTNALVCAFTHVECHLLLSLIFFYILFNFVQPHFKSLMLIFVCYYLRNIKHCKQFPLTILRSF